VWIAVTSMLEFVYFTFTSLWWRHRWACIHGLTLDRCHTCNFIAQLDRARKSQVWHGVWRNSLTVTQLLFGIGHSSTLCNFVARIRWTLIGQFLFMRQSCSVWQWHVPLHTVTLSRAKVARQNRAIKLQVWHRS